ncbi:hypothetical protein AUK11_02930 [bacterium CG2_30_37_16]|nr:MAG: hypothetical protein AUK11_02930 [bacterium CG2_30_37_16]
MRQERKEIIKRINYVTGQLQGIRKMIEENRNCLEVVQQLKASKSGVENIIAIMAHSEICQSHLSEEELKKVIKIISSS